VKRKKKDKGGQGDPKWCFEKLTPPGVRGPKQKNQTRGASEWKVVGVGVGVSGHGNCLAFPKKLLGTSNLGLVKPGVEIGRPLYNPRNETLWNGSRGILQKRPFLFFLRTVKGYNGPKSKRLSVVGKNKREWGSVGELVKAFFGEGNFPEM